MAVVDSFPEYRAFERRVAETLRAERNKAGLTLQDMADRLNMHRNTLGKCENNGLGLGLDILFGYAQVCHLPISAFINPFDQLREPGGNPLQDLTESELIRYSEVLQELFTVFANRGMKLSGERLYEATRLVALAVRDKRQPE